MKTDVYRFERALSDIDGINELAEKAAAYSGLDEKQKLFKAIRDAKSRLDIDMDSEVSLNAARQCIARTFKHMNDLRSSEQTISGGGTGYRFNAD